MSGSGGDDRTRVAQGGAAGRPSREASTGELRSEGLIRELARDLRPVRPLPPCAASSPACSGCGSPWPPWGSRCWAGRRTWAPCWPSAPCSRSRWVSWWRVSAGSWPPRPWACRVANGSRAERSCAAERAWPWPPGSARCSSCGAPPWSPGRRSSDLHCLLVACAVGLLPALGVVAFAGRAAPHRPLVLAVAAAAGAVALGTVAAQASCPYADLRHLLMGHALAPALGALLLVLPLLVALHRTERAAGD